MPRASTWDIAPRRVWWLGVERRVPLSTVRERRISITTSPGRKFRLDHFKVSFDQINLKHISITVDQEGSRIILMIGLCPMSIRKLSEQYYLILNKLHNVFNVHAVTEDSTLYLTLTFAECKRRWKALYLRGCQHLHGRSAWEGWSTSYRYLGQVQIFSWNQVSKVWNLYLNFCHFLNLISWSSCKSRWKCIKVMTLIISAKLWPLISAKLWPLISADRYETALQNRLPKQSVKRTNWNTTTCPSLLPL